MNAFTDSKELFDGLWIAEQGEWEWNVHPVITLDFNEIPASTPEALRQNLSFRLQEYWKCL
ncbi:MAG: AAA family ATPase [bacterium]|nr:AAA family ATPase [bacterium]